MPGHTSCGCSPVADASTSASVGPGAPSSKDCTGLRAATATPSARSCDERLRRRPTSCRSRWRCRRRRRASRRGHRSASAFAKATTWSSVWAADSATRSREVPAGTVGGRMAGTSRPWSSSRRADASRARSLVAEHDGHDRRRVPGRDPFDVARAAGRRGVALGRAHDAKRARAAAVSAGVGAVVKMNGRAALTTRSMSAARSGDEAAERRRASSTACRRAATVDLGVGVGIARAEHGVGLVEHEQRAVSGARRHELVERRDVAVHREHGVGHDDRAAPSCPRSSASTWSTSPWRAIVDLGRATAGSRR